MWQLPRAVSLAAGAGEGITALNAFDRALAAAGVADLNFIRVTSILPAGARLITTPPFPPGLLVPAVYARIISHTAGERIAAAIGVGISRGDGHGVIMEHSHTGTAEHAEAVVRRMVREAFDQRGLELEAVAVAASEHTVERVGCVVALALFWPTPTGPGP